MPTKVTRVVREDAIAGVGRVEECRWPSSRPSRRSSIPTGGRWSRPRFVIAILLMILLGIAWIVFYYVARAGRPRPPSRRPSPARPPFMADLEKLELRDRLRADLPRPAARRAHPSTPLGRGRGVVVGHARLLPVRPAVDLHVLRALAATSCRRCRSSTTSTSTTCWSASASWPSASPTPPAGSECAAGELLRGTSDTARSPVRDLVTPYPRPPATHSRSFHSCGLTCGE